MTIAIADMNTYSATAVLMGRSIGTIYIYVRQKKLDTVAVGARRYITGDSIRRMLAGEPVVR